MMSSDITEKLLAALDKIDRPDQFCSQGSLPAILPGLNVKGLGSIALPLTAAQAEDLKGCSRQAPYGKGTQTLVDEKVRRVWEIDADKVTFANSEWTKVLDQATNSIQAELGIEELALTAHLYKLLVYEKGSFFLPHRDGEKLDRMVATLVIVLPSAHEGGELVIRHDGQEVVIPFGGQENQFHIQYAAFYADCEHEVRRVKSGFRLALTYNLTLARSKKTITAPTTAKHVDEIAKLLPRWYQSLVPKQDDVTSTSSSETSPSKLVVLLDHKYTKVGLSFDALKGIDRARAIILQQAAEKTGGDAFLALVTHWVAGSADPSCEVGYGYQSGRSRYGYNSYEDEDEDEECDDMDDDDDEPAESSHVMDEIMDQSLQAAEFVDARGNRLAFGEIPVAESEIVSADEITDRNPDKEDFEGYTGNAGMTLERWYHRAAVIIWPRHSRLNILCEAGGDTAVGGLQMMLTQANEAKTADRGPRLDECRQFAALIIKKSHQERSWKHWQARDEAPFLKVLLKLEDVDLVRQWTDDVLGNDVLVDPGNLVGDLCSKFGWSTYRKSLVDVFRKTSNNTLPQNVKILNDFALRNDQDEERKQLCTALGHELVAGLDRWDNSRPTSNYWEHLTVEVSKILPLLIQAFAIEDDPALLGLLLSQINKYPKRYDIDATQIPVFLGLQSWLKNSVKKAVPPLRQWLEQIQQVLQTRESNPPQAPKDYRRASAIDCKCPECKKMAQFLGDPGVETLTFPLVAERRSHLEEKIRSNELDIEHHTLTRGRPYSLVMKKTQKSYQRLLATYQQDCEHLKKIESLLAWQAELAKQDKGVIVHSPKRTRGSRNK
jgi:hypothetical protein